MILCVVPYHIGKSDVLRGPVADLRCHHWVVVSEILDRDAFAKSCFPPPHLSLRADGRVGVDLGPCPVLFFIKDRQKRKGKDRKM